MQPDVTGSMSSAVCVVLRGLIGTSEEGLHLGVIASSVDVLWSRNDCFWMDASIDFNL